MRAGFLIVFAWAAFGQPVEPAPKFLGADVGINPHAYPVLNGPLTGGGLYKLQSATMVDLIRIAYIVEAARVVGGPNWLELDRFDVIAKPPDGATAEGRRLMLQALLADRFHLMVKPGTQPMRASALVAGQHLHLKPGDGGGQSFCGYFRPESGLTPTTMIFRCRNMSMSDFAEQVRNIGRQGRFRSALPVVDRTGLSGGWDFEFQYDPQLTALDDNSYLSQLLEKQVGLKLEDVKISAPVIEVRSVDRTPTPNAPDLAKIIPPLPSEFEAVEIKPADLSPDARREMEFKNGRVYIPQITVSYLITMAWNHGSEMVGMPKWAEAERVDFIAKAPPEVSVENVTTAAGLVSVDLDPLRPMLRRLLTSRYKLTMHTEERPRPAYALVAVKPTLEKADPSARIGCHDGPTAGSSDPKATSRLGRLVTCENMTMAQFAESIRQIDGMDIHDPVFDATGIEGAWQFSFNFLPLRQLTAANQGGEAEAADPAGRYSIFDALGKQLGLKLEMQKRPVPVMVIDHMER